MKYNKCLEGYRLPLKESKLHLDWSWVGEGSTGSQELIMEPNLKGKNKNWPNKGDSTLKVKGKTGAGGLWGRHKHKRKHQ